MTTGIVAVSTEASLMVQANAAASTSLVPADRRIARRGTVLIRDRRGPNRASFADIQEQAQSQVEALASAYVNNVDLGLADRLDVAGQYWFYATMLTSGNYPTITVWA